MRIAILVPHIFMDQKYLGKVIFSPGTIAIDLATSLINLGHEVTLFSPGKIPSKNFKNIIANFNLIDKELELRGYDINELIKKHPLTYITFARQVQAQLIAKCYKMANQNKFDLIHVWINEEDIALQFAEFVKKPIVFTHHEPFNFLSKYKTIFSNFKNLNWVSISFSQRKTIDTKMNWIGNVYHGFKDYDLKKVKVHEEYFLYIGRIIQPKGVHLAVEAIYEFNKLRIKNNLPIIKLKIAGLYYNDSYWKKISDKIDNKNVEYLGFLSKEKEKLNVLSQAKAMIMPSTWPEPFGMTLIESLSVGTPIIGLDNGSLKEIINAKNGILAKTKYLDKSKMIIDEAKTVVNLVDSMQKIDKISNSDCLDDFRKRFSLERMAKDYENIYKFLLKSNSN